MTANDSDVQCCFVAEDGTNCQALAEWEIWHLPRPDDVTEACTEHVGPLLLSFGSDDRNEFHVYPFDGLEYFENEQNEVGHDA